METDPASPVSCIRASVGRIAALSWTNSKPSTPRVNDQHGREGGRKKGRTGGRKEGLMTTPVMTRMRMSLSLIHI
jgi:hypothetical protein